MERKPRSGEPRRLDVSPASRPPLTRAHLIGVAAAVLSGTAAGGSDAVVKLIYQVRVDVPTVLVVRFVAGAVVLWLVVLWLRIPTGLPSSKSFGLLILGAIGVAIPTATFYQALKLLSVSTTVLLVYIYPTFVAVLAVVLRRERWRWESALLLLSSMLGLLLLVGWSSQQVTGPGIAFALLTAVGTAGYIVVSERAVRNVDPLAAAALLLTGAATSLVLVTAAFGAIRLPQTAKAWSLLILLGAILLPIIYIGLVTAIVRIGATRAAIGGTLEPLVATLLGMIVLGEHLTLARFVGGLLIVGSAVLFLLVVRPRPIEPSRQAPIRGRTL